MHLEYAVFGLGTPEVVLIAILALVLFGGKKIPELMRGLGEGVREFNAAKANIKQEIETGMKEKPAPAKETAEEKKA
ncbi:MAG TPA: twin-arginine translocase TatA/TatE family subunit [Chitinophagales bacterium]|nr:twin-arginine translocase TatA/TatE family subunit [Chitinophagales bacterium]